VPNILGHSDVLLSLSQVFSDVICMSFLQSRAIVAETFKTKKTDFVTRNF